jgi:hypothetical protein
LRWRQLIGKELFDFSPEQLYCRESFCDLSSISII